MATIKDVAQMAKVSVATVSRVLNKSESVTPRTRQKVLAAIQALNYNPNLLGRNLRQSRTNKILVLLPTVSNMFYSRIVSSIEKRASENGYNTMLCVTGSDRDKEEEYLTLLRTHLADGVIFLSSQQSSEEISALAENFPVVQCCESVPGAKLPTVSIDNYRAGKDAVRHLQELGHERIAFLGLSAPYGSSMERQRGYCDRMQEAGLPLREDYLWKENSYSYQSGMHAAQKLMQLEEPPTAIFAVADSLAVGVVNFLLTHGYKVGEGGISVVGFDDTALSRMYLPAITTISQPQAALGEQAMSLLLNQMRPPKKPSGEPKSTEVFLEHKLKIRESTGRVHAPQEMHIKEENLP